jgi:16S rRNA (uracil1498-N3)-methyltransferase
MLLVRLFYAISAIDPSYPSFQSGSCVMQRLAIDPHQIQPPYLQLTPEQQHYLQRVLRLKAGAEFLALPGDGNAWRCELDGDHARVLDAVAVTTELPIAVTLALALPKTGFDDVVRQVTELGVGRILPLLTERTLLKPSDNKRDRWQKIAAEATEQSERAIVPQVLEPIAFKLFLNAESASNAPRLLCWGRGESPHLLTVLSTVEHQETLTICVGPEGGWSDREVAMAIESGFQTVSLGSRILRAVTAPMAVMAIVGGVVETRSP